MKRMKTPTTEEVRDAFCTLFTTAIAGNEKFYWEMSKRFDRWLATEKAEAWEQGKRAEKTAWMHIFDGHPVEEGEMCDECPTDNPYRTRT